MTRDSAESDTLRQSGFTYQTMSTGDTTISFAVGGAGPPLLLLHGYPQNHNAWREVAPELAKEFQVVCPDLRGYGDSSKPEGLADHSNYSKRAMAAEMVALMAALGHRRFALAGHDRGARVGYRLALDHAEAVERLALLDIVSTKAVYECADAELARLYFHWYFLIQHRPLPETLIGTNPDGWFDALLPAGCAMRQDYLRTSATSEGIHASCEDYRAGYFVDLDHDRADVSVGMKISCPTLILWGRHSVVGRLFDPLHAWRDLVTEPTGQEIDCGHFIPEEAPKATVRLIRAFLLGS